MANDPWRIALLAMEAQAPEVEYRYILPGASDGHIDLWGPRRGVNFIEKPDGGRAQELVNAGGLWNTMIRVFKA